MKTINCPKCNFPVEINIVSAVDEQGEVFVCPKCGYKFRFADK